MGCPPGRMTAMDYRTDASFDVVGGFWRPDAPQTIETGTLRSDDGRLTLAMSPTYGTLDRTALIEAFGAVGSPSEISETSCLCGNTRIGRCTLLNLFGGDNKGILDAGQNIQINANEFEPSCEVVGLHPASAQEEST